MSTLNYSVGEDPDSGDSGATYDTKVGNTFAELANRSGREQIPFMIVNPTARDYRLITNTRYPFTVDDCTFETDAGTITATLKINSTSVTSVSSIACTTSEQTVSASANKDAAIGDNLVLTLASPSGITALHGNIWIDRTGAGTA